MSLALPSFYDPDAVGSVYIERAAVVAAEAVEARGRLGLRPAAEDRVRVAAFGIDCQVGFCVPGASLFVPGAVEDSARALSWIYGNLDRITSLIFSLDTHAVHQIFHPAFWVDAEGRHPAPLTTISAQDVRGGRFKPVEASVEVCLEYCQRLEDSGRYVLTIWPWHTLLGGVSHALVPAMMEASIYHGVARRQPTRFELKGAHPLTENYSVLSPEVTELGGQRVGAFNEGLFEALMSHDRVYVFGQASSHCVLSTLRDLHDRILSTDPALVDRVYVLQDAMSPVPAPPLDPLPPSLDFPALAARGLEALAEAGFHLVKTTDPLDLGR